MSSCPVPLSPRDEKSLVTLLPPPSKKGKGRPLNFTAFVRLFAIIAMGEMWLSH